MHAVLKKRVSAYERAMAGFLCPDKPNSEYVDIPLDMPELFDDSPVW
jgi:hypothetical protein